MRACDVGSKQQSLLGACCYTVIIMDCRSHEGCDLSRAEELSGLELIYENPCARTDICSSSSANNR